MNAKKILKVLALAIVATGVMFGSSGCITITAPTPVKAQL